MRTSMTVSHSLVDWLLAVPKWYVLMHEKLIRST